MNSKAERVLIYRLGSLGDTVVALPCFHQIARAYPQAERLLLTNIPVHAKAPAAFAVLENSGLVDGFLRYPIAARGVKELLELRRQIQSFRPDVLVYLTPRRKLADVIRDAAFFQICGIPKIIGLPFSRAARTNLPDAQTGICEPEAARLARWMRPLGAIDLNDRACWDLRLTEQEREKATEVLRPIANRPLIACSIGTKMQAKDWGAENWRAVLDALASELPQYGLALVGAPEEAALSESAASAWAGRYVQLCGKLTPRESAAVLAHAQFFLGVDSGPMHLAATMDVPCVIVFAARTRPRIWFPWGEQHEILYRRTDCWNCGLEICTVQKKKCLTAISHADVLAAAHRVLARKASAG
jgi:ADP-heptose:LPS heptosyltransferase